MQSSNDSQVTAISLTVKTVFQWPSSCESTKKLYSTLHTQFQERATSFVSISKVHLSRIPSAQGVTVICGQFGPERHHLQQITFTDEISAPNQ
jgi:hypothetical protein